MTYETPVYFAVVKQWGRESPRKFFETIPQSLLTKERARELIYCTRLDTLPNGETMITAPLDDLMKVYLRLKAAGKLPPEDRGIKPKAKDIPPNGNPVSENA